VLARLPFTIILRFCTVCRQWNNLLSSIRFFQHCTQVPQAHPWFYITFGNNNYEAMYDPLMKGWYCSTAKLPKLPIRGLPVSSVGGLVCLQDTFLNMYICNPLTQSFKILPKSNKNWLHSGMTMNGSGGYRVLQFGGREYEIYDSVTKCRSHVRKIPATVTCHCVSNSISIGTTLYIRRVYPDGIISCDTWTGVWTNHLFPNPLNIYENEVTLAESNGRINVCGSAKEEWCYMCMHMWASGNKFVIERGWSNIVLRVLQEAS